MHPPAYTYGPHGWKKCTFSLEPDQNFPPILLNFPPFLYVFLYFRGKNSLQMSKFPRNQVPEFPIFFPSMRMAAGEESHLRLREDCCKDFCKNLWILFHFICVLIAHFLSRESKLILAALLMRIFAKLDSQILSEILPLQYNISTVSSG